jgi:glycosyltransferase involved in cell wall biosynthesis
MKDKGLAGYTLSKELNARCVMYFASEREDYPYADALPGLELLRDGSESGIADVYNEHLLANYPDMDVLALHGPYPQTMDYLNNYRKLRPDGKVYCGLDMNSLWAEDYPWEHEYATRLFSQCDVIATSCRHTRDALNRDPRVSFPCRWFPNGFYNVTGKRAEADAERKENVIITVGRIGNKYKNNEELMVAYARASNELDGWTLKFIGPVETKIEPFKAHYFKERPDLKDRVVFTGAINDKDELYGEYAKAKIFALTSTKEGGPNVYAEALFHGCMFITSDIDAADDMTNYGQLGKKYKLGDPDELADMLIEMCNKADKKAFEKHIPKALKYARRYYDWNRNAKKLRYMLYRS